MSFASEVLSDSPLFWAKNDEVSGTTLTDTISAHNGTWTGGPTFGAADLTGDGGTSVTLAGAQSATVAGAAWMNVAAYTVEFLVKTTSSGTVWTRDDSSGATTKVWNAAINATGQFVFTVFTTGGTGHAMQSPLTRLVNDGHEHIVTVTRSGNDVRMWVDGYYCAYMFVTGQNTSATQSMVIGKRGGGSTGFFTGSLDNMLFYGTALSDARVLAHAQQVTTISVSLGDDYTRALNAYLPAARYKFEESSGSVANGEIIGGQSTGAYVASSGSVVLGQPGFGDGGSSFRCVAATDASFLFTFADAVPTTSTTFLWWFKFGGGSNTTLIGNTGGLSTNRITIGFANANADISFSMPGPITTTLVGKGTLIADGNWHLMGLVFTTGGSWELFSDGPSLGTNSYTGTPSAAFGSTVRLGRSPIGASTGPHWFDDFAVIPQALTGTQQANLATIYSGRRAINRVTETETARTLSVSMAKAVSRVTETDTARSIIVGKGVLIGRVIETDTARSIGKSITKAIGRIVEIDTARPIAVFATGVGPVVRLADGTLLGNVRFADGTPLDIDGYLDDDGSTILPFA